MKKVNDPVKEAYQELERRYKELKQRAQKFADDVYSALLTPILMFRYPKDKMHCNWNLTDLYERTRAAQQLGHRVVIHADDDGLHVRYEKQLNKNREWF